MGIDSYPPAIDAHLLSINVPKGGYCEVNFKLF